MPHPSQILILAPRDTRLSFKKKKKGGSLSFKELSVPPSGTPAYFMSKNYGPISYKYLQQWQNLTKDNLELQWSLWGMFQLDMIL